MDTLILRRPPLLIFTNIPTIDQARAFTREAQRWPMGVWWISSDHQVVFDTERKPLMSLRRNTLAWIDNSWMPLSPPSPRESAVAWPDSDNVREVLFFDGETPIAKRPTKIRNRLRALGVPAEMIEASIEGYNKEEVLKSREQK